MKTTAEILQKLFSDGKSPLSEQFIRWKLWRRWPSIVGPEISNVSEPTGYFKGRLYVYVKDPVWLHQLNFLKDEIRTKINKALEITYVQEMRFHLEKKSAASIDREEFQGHIDKLK